MSLGPHPADRIAWDNSLGLRTFFLRNSHWRTIVLNFVLWAFYEAASLNLRSCWWKEYFHANKARNLMTYCLSCSEFGWKCFLSNRKVVTWELRAKILSVGFIRNHQNTMEVGPTDRLNSLSGPFYIFESQFSLSMEPDPPIEWSFCWTATLPTYFQSVPTHNLG